MKERCQCCFEWTKYYDYNIDEQVLCKDCQSWLYYTIYEVKIREMRGMKNVSGKISAEKCI